MFFNIRIIRIKKSFEVCICAKAFSILGLFIALIEQNMTTEGIILARQRVLLLFTKSAKMIRCTLLAMGWCLALSAQAQQQAVTDSGEEVMLYDDGT